MKIKILTLILLLSFGGKAVSQETVKTSSDTDFPFKLFKLMREKDSNFVYSPFSIYSASALLYAGAAGETKKEISSVFGYAADNELFLNDFKNKTIGNDVDAATA